MPCDGLAAVQAVRNALASDVSRNLHIVPKSKYWNNKITIDTIFYCSDNNFSYYRHQFSPAVTSCLSLCDGELFSLRRYLILNCDWVVDNNFEWQCDGRQSRFNRTIIMILISTKTKNDNENKA